jgi:hypothetical protein
MTARGNPPSPLPPRYFSVFFVHEIFAFYSSNPKISY